jgi:glycosyltransferase involved in cell wall biosynthesis
MVPFFTIVIPTLNEELTLPFILKDLARQKEKNFEVVIVDGSSEDGTEKIARSFSSQFPIRFLTVKKRNVSYQRNTGARHAYGTFVIFFDADARISTAFTKKLYLFINKHRGLVYIPAILPDEMNSQTKVIFNLANFVVDISQSIGRPFSSGGSMIFEKHFFLHIGGFAENVYMSEDHQMIQTAFKYGVHARFMRDIKVKMSLRRMRKQGQLKLFFQYILTAAQYIIKGKIDTKTIEYQMGGQFYLKKDPNMSVEERLQAYIDEAKRFFKTVISS